MAGRKSTFVCSNCGKESVKWMGNCPDCGQWNSFKEVSFDSFVKKSTGGEAVKSSRLEDVKTKNLQRMETGISELDKSLGGGIVPGQVILLAGEPGIGKSTILLQVAKNLQNVFYASGEESLAQVKMRAQRLKIESGISLVSATDVDSILSAVETDRKKDYKAIFIDSIQTMHTRDLTGAPGSVGQVRECALRLIRYAKKTGIPIVIVGHVTKDGSVAGPTTLMHMVDTVCWFEGESREDLRLIRIMKNRFGPTDEVGIFVMGGRGLVPMQDIDKYLLERDFSTRKVAGSVTSCIMEGSRTMLVEVQALVIPTKLSIPRRVVQGIDSKRVELILAVLTKHCRHKLYNYDVFVNVVGGVKIKDTSLDLAVAAAISSSLKNKPVKKDLAFVGEVGLLGDVRGPLKVKKYISHLRKYGYKVVGLDAKRVCEGLEGAFD